jgi:hypothetical protein
VRHLSISLRNKRPLEVSLPLAEKPITERERGTGDKQKGNVLHKKEKEGREGEKGNKKDRERDADCASQMHRKRTH